MKSVVESLETVVARMEGESGYPDVGAAPYGPTERYPELEGKRVEVAEGEKNRVFPLVREALRGLGLDAGRYGSAEWNPLGALVREGGTVLVKPNWVLHKNLGGKGMDCMVTHPSVLRAVLEYVFLARPGRVVLGDAPLQGCDFEALMGWGGLGEVIDVFRKRGLPLEVADFRRTVSDATSGLQHVRENVREEGRYVTVDVGEDSFLEEISADWKRFRVTVYDPRWMGRHHRPGKHEYFLAREAFEADLVVNCPKLKTHKKAGMTCCLKNLIGINGNKEYLPHHRKGAAGRGDSHPVASPLLWGLESAMDVLNRMRGWPRVYALGERVVYGVLGRLGRRSRVGDLEGNWKGNDTIWRTCLDLNRALLYGDAEGRLHGDPQRETVSIVDAVVAGEGDGPLSPSPLKTGAVLAARNPGAGDWLAARVLGLDPRKIPLVAHAADAVKRPVCRAGAGEVESAVRAALEGKGSFPEARPAPGWEGIEGGVRSQE